MSFYILSLIIFIIKSSFTNSNHQYKNILVIGGTGRVGKLVISKLVKQGNNVKIMTRNPIKEIESEDNNNYYKGSTIVRGDINNVEDIISASKDCQAIISVHGVKPPRISRISDLWTHPRNDLSHPYNVNYIGTKKILAAMNINKINKFVRITGALTNKNEFSFFVFLFNLILSQTIKWHEMSEISIRNSGVDYTVIRPPGIRDNYDNTTTNRQLVLIPGDNKNGIKLPGQISTDDLSNLIIHSLSDNRLSKSTVICASEPITQKSDHNNNMDWNTLISNNNIGSDTKVIKRRKHNLATLMYSSVILYISSLASKLLFALGKLLFKNIKTFI